MVEPVDTDPRLLQISTVLSERSLCLHATCVRAFGKGLLLIGPSGSGKSDIALQLMAYGAELVADDQTILASLNEQLIASCPEETLGKIEARGMALLRANMAPRVMVSTMVYLDHIESDRLPAPKTIQILGHPVRLFYKSPSGAFAASVFQYLRVGEITT